MGRAGMGERKRKDSSRDVSNRVSNRSRLALVISHHVANGAGERTSEGRSCA